MMHKLIEGAVHFYNRVMDRLFERSAAQPQYEMASGDIRQSSKSGSWDDFFRLADSAEIPSDFMDDRSNEPLQERNLF